MQTKLIDYEIMAKLMKIGKNQMGALRALRNHGSWYPGCGWIWSNRSETVRLLESLVRRGYVEKELRERQAYLSYLPRQAYIVYLPKPGIFEPYELIKPTN